MVQAFWFRVHRFLRGLSAWVCTVKRRIHRDSWPQYTVRFCYPPSDSELYKNSTILLGSTVRPPEKHCPGISIVLSGRGIHCYGVEGVGIEVFI